MSVETKAAIINGKFTVFAAVIAGIFGIIVAIIETAGNGKLKKEYEELQTECADLYTKLNTLQENYDTLDYEKANLENDNKVLQTQNNDLQNQIADIPTLNQKIVSLEEEYKNLNQQIGELESGIDQPESPQKPEPSEESEPIISKVSIFDLDTFQSSSYFIDTYDNSHEMAKITFHRAIDKNDDNNPIYLLDKKYSLCEGQIAWSKEYKNSKNSAWIEFYAIDEDCDRFLYKTEPSITADHRALDFSFSVVGVEKMKIVANGTDDLVGVPIIYQHLDLIK